MKIGFLQELGQFSPQGIVHHQPFFLSEKLDKCILNNLLYGIAISTGVYFLLSRFTRLTDGQTDGNLVANTVQHSMQRGKNEVIAQSLHGMQMRSYDEISVCPSVKRVHCDKKEERFVYIFIPYERSFILVF